MTPYINDADFKLYVGDVRDVLKELPAGSVDCCVTSPPYWGLRCYGHDDQIGLEATPEQFVAELVEVFRGVRRVLADHGTVWLNLGSSYMANPSGSLEGSTLSKGGKQTASSRAGGAARRDAADPGSACLDLCGECVAALWSHSPHTDPLPHVSASPVSPTSRGSGRRDSVGASPAASAPASQASTQPGSSPLPPALCWRCGTQPASVSLQVQPTFSPYVPPFLDTEAHTNGTAENGSASRIEGTDAEGMAWVNYTSKLKHKDLVPIPWMVAMALQHDGWYLRSEIIWAKKNCMPESVTDRPTKSHEQIFLLTKNPRYHFDQEAVREAYTPDDRIKRVHDHAVDGGHENYASMNGGKERWANSGRNIRSVWEIATQPYPDAHFATFPEALPERCIKAGCPEQVCGTCGKPRERIVERTQYDPPSAADGERFVDASRGDKTRKLSGKDYNESVRVIGESWSDCGHNNWRPGTVLDPFMGSGTTAKVARRLGRRSIGVELNPEYAALCAKRLQQLSLLAETAA